MKPPKAWLLLFALGLTVLSGLGFAATDAQPVVRFASRPGVSADLPDWARAADQPERELVMDVTVAGRAERLDVAVSYELRVPADDPLLPLLASGRVDGADLGEYLAYGPVNTPVTVERSAGAALAKLRFRYAGSVSERLFLGTFDSTANVAAQRVHRWLTVRAGDVVIGRVDPEPAELRPRLVYFSGPPQMVDVWFADDVPAAARTDAAYPYDAVGYVVTALQAAWPWLVWCLVTTAPWLVLVRAVRNRSRFAVVSRTAGVLGAALGVVAAVASWRYFSGDGMLASLLVLVVVAGFAPVLRPQAAARWRVSGYAVAGAVLTTWVVVAVFAAEGSVRWPLVALMVPVAAGTAVAGRRAAAGPAGAAVVWTAGVAVAFGAAATLLDLPLTLTVVGVTAVAAVSLAVAAPRRSWAVPALLLCGLATVPAVQVVTDPRDVLGFYAFDGYVLPPVTRLAALAFGLYAVMFLRRAGTRGAALGSRTVLATALVLLLIVATDPFPFSWVHLAATGWLLLGWRWAVPAGRRARAVRLAGVDRDRHRTLVGQETRRRLAEASAHDLYRKARARLGAEEVRLAAYDAAQHELDEAARLPVPSRAVTSLDALSTGGGAAPWPNAVRALAYAAPVAALLVGYETFALLAPDSAAAAMRWRTVADLVELAAHMGRWFVYALLFGYLYPLLRGDGPVTKGAAFAVALLGIEVLPLFDLPGRVTGESSVLTPVSAGEVLLAVLIRVGQLVMFIGVLSLLWERWLARAAGYSWDRVRNVRSARALVAPVGTVVVAGLTTAATAVAGAAVVALLATGPAPATDPGARESPGAGAGP
ncbi:hypothetical protein Daura_19075 [Dactylosporangium aurantiacum]|uniref:LigA protein n=1 Tax=Dactylosporangium aurantiacum TaxID=35754 RepID=A0A9Q9IRJ6_9ACTN|nr:hypothetical protein [Dactylosporangium aurantiacum]MDG6109923.1 hypothetical protein [Dactylosporangium aurantiacum]UWZ58080.1 hypothetical protein Daura_19075 [Dactylosporangium aurantiacum]